MEKKNCLWTRGNPSEGVFETATYMPLKLYSPGGGVLETSRTNPYQTSLTKAAKKKNQRVTGKGGKSARGQISCKSLKKTEGIPHLIGFVRPLYSGAAEVKGFLGNKGSRWGMLWGGGSLLPNPSGGQTQKTLEIQHRRESEGGEVGEKGTTEQKTEICFTKGEEKGNKR